MFCNVVGLADRKSDDCQCRIFSRTCGELAAVRNKQIINTLFDEIAPVYSDRQGGYTRVVKLGRRSGDAAPISLLQLVDFEKLGESAKKKTDKKKDKTPEKKTDERISDKDKPVKAVKEEVVKEPEKKIEEVDEKVEKEKLIESEVKEETKPIQEETGEQSEETEEEKDKDKKE